ncbi:VOC family protein [Paludisphaera mucosa]|uniref:VOC family protein n=1 Tax=Paludisphaera mucosa TaxID=3030827 RepID=A0ABT6FIT5_9BACT|nr:VOC family protein [Paludisphaera mucosa]MDG3007491.1 VOC family protein [Paludisphaera mucosa]
MPEAIPSGFRTITPYLAFNGAAEAIEFYKKAFGAEELVRMPFPGPDGQMVVGHAELKIGDSMVMLGMACPEQGSVAPGGGGASVSIHLYVPDVDAVFARAIEAGGTAAMPPTDMPWGDRFGKLVDPFGHHWSVATHIEDVSPEEMQRRMAEMCAGVPAEVV